MYRTALMAAAILLNSTISVAGVCAENPAQVPPEQRAARNKALQAKKNDLFSHMGIQQTNQIPVNFPVPAYSSNVVSSNFISTTKGRPSASATIITRDPPTNVYNFYLDACNKASYKVIGHRPKASKKPSAADKYYSLTGKKGKQELVILCLQQPKFQGTMISMTWSLHRK